MMLRPSEKAGLALHVGFRNRLARERRVVIHGHGVPRTTTIEATLSYFLAKISRPMGTRERKAQRALRGKIPGDPDYTETLWTGSAADGVLRNPNRPAIAPCEVADPGRESVKACAGE